MDARISIKGWSMKKILLAIFIFIGATASEAQYTVPRGMPCGGVVVAGYCWYLTDGMHSDQTCHAKCASHGGPNDYATINYAGSGGNDAQCIEVLTKLGALGTHYSSSNNSCGCQYDGAANSWWSIALTTDPTYNQGQYMVCACNN